MTEALLDDLLIVDLSRGVAGGYCCLLFGRLGAQVIKVDEPGHFGKTKVLPYVLPYIHAGKKSITLANSKAEGAALLLRLAERADVLVTDATLPPGLDYAALSRQNPRLILTLVTPAPSNGDALFAEYFTGLNAFAATLLPLVNMSVLGRGQQVEVDGAECLAAAAFAVDGQGQWPQPEAGEPFPPPLRVAGQAGGPAPTAANPGEHNDEVYRGLLGLSAEELARLKEASVI